MKEPWEDLSEDPSDGRGIGSDFHLAVVRTGLESLGNLCWVPQTGSVGAKL